MNNPNSSENTNSLNSKSFIEVIAAQENKNKIKNILKIKSRNSQNRLYNLLVQACVYGNLETVKLLIGKGVDLNYKDEIDSTNAAVTCIIYDKIEILKYIVEQGLNIKNKEYLYLSTTYNNIPLIEYLLIKVPEFWDSLSNKYEGPLTQKVIGWIEEEKIKKQHKSLSQEIPYKNTSTPQNEIIKLKDSLKSKKI